MLRDSGFNNDFVVMTPESQAPKPKINKGDDIKPQNSCTTKGTIDRGQRRAPQRESDCNSQTW